MNERRDWDKEFWSIVMSYNRSDLDPIMQAAQDFRVTRAAAFLLGSLEYDVCGPDWHDLSVQIAEEYLLSPEEVVAAMEISEDRLARGQ